jgi:hypothetical protein
VAPPPRGHLDATPPSAEDIPLMPLRRDTLTRTVLVAGGLLLAALAAFMPDGWYDPLPPADPMSPPPVSGWLLLRVLLGFDALILFSLAARPPSFHRVPAEGRLALPAPPAARGSWRAWLVAVVGVGLALRLFRLDTGLWLDEIAALLLYRDASAWQIATSYVSSGNHLLNTLLVNLVTAVLGEEAWTVRLPAVLFGVASLPAVYWIARQAMSAAASLLVTLLLAVSYHHIFFSQNARGYTAYLFFALLSAGLLGRGLRDDRLRDWVWWVGVIVLGFASQLIAAFVLAAQALVAGAALWRIVRNGGPAMPMLRRLVVVMTAAIWATLHLYIVVAPNAYVYARTVYVDPAAGYGGLSADLLAEIVRGVSAGFGRGLLLLAAPAAFVAAVGAWRLVTRHWPMVVCLAAPPLLQFALSVVRGLVVSPRFFILLLPFVCMAAVEGTEWLAGRIVTRLRWSAERGATITAVVVVLVSVGSLASLPRYYATPKQAYGEALGWIAARREPGDAVLAIHYAVSGVRYYGARMGWQEDRDFRAVRTVPALEAAVADAKDRPIWLVVTFPRALHLNAPDLEARVRAEWAMVREFPATIGDGAISIWRRPPLPPR